MARIDRKTLKGPDRFQREATHAARWIAGHWPVAVGLAVVLLVALVGTVLWHAYAERREAEAAARLTAAVRVFEGGEAAGSDGRSRSGGDPALWAQAALPLLRDVASGYRGTGPGALAQLYVGHALLRAGDAKGAEGAYGAALAVAPNDLAREAARYGLGHARLAQGKAEAAVEAWRPLTEQPGPYQALAWHDAARAYEALGRTEEARKAYEAGRTALATTRLGTLTEERLAALGGAPAAPAGGRPPAGSPTPAPATPATR